MDGYDDSLPAQASPLNIRCPIIPANQTHNGHMYYLLMPTLEMRQTFIRTMKDLGITTPFHYVPLHSSPAGLHYGRTAGSMNITNQVSDTLVRIPLFYGLKDQGLVLAAITQAFDTCR